MAVITISRQYGSCGDEIAALICSITGYHLFDKDILARAALDSGFSGPDAIDFCEDNYRVKNFLDNLFGISQPVVSKRFWKETKDGIRIAETYQVNEEQSLYCVRKAVETAHRLDNYVIVGRAGQVLLQDQADVLHVRIIAPMEERIFRVRNSPEMMGQTYNDSMTARRAAQAIIEKHDSASAEYLHRFYGVDWSSPHLYHILLNTAKLTIEQTAEIIIKAANLL